MEDIRLKQAEKLIKIAGEASKKKEDLKEATSGTINVELFERALKELIYAEDYIYPSLPSHHLSAPEARIFTGKLLAARESIENILSDFGVMEKLNSKDQIRQLSQKWLIITPKTSFKKILMKMGVDVQNIIVAGVPLASDDMKLLNPHLPEAALKAINKKIEHVKNDISKKKEKLNLINIMVLAEDDLNGEILGKRAMEFYKAKVFLKPNLKDIKDSELIKILQER